MEVLTKGLVSPQPRPDITITFPTKRLRDWSAASLRRTQRGSEEVAIL
jgi:hypothetical protein